MHINRLSARRVASAGVGFWNDGGCLYLQVTEGPRGFRRSWIFRYGFGGRTRDMGLGPIETVGLGEARVLARGLRQQILAGIDPIDARRAQRAAIVQQTVGARTFEDCAKAYISAHAVSWRSATHARQWNRSLVKFVYPVIGKLPVSRVDVPQVLRVLEPIWTTIPETASRVRGRLEVVLAWATAAGFRQGDNPAAWSHLQHLLPSPRKLKGSQHLEALAYADVGEFIVRLRAVSSTAARALEFAILTAARSNEVLGARWDEVDDDGVWTVPATRTKSGKPHRIPLSIAALDVIEHQRTIARSERVFPGNHDMMRRVLAKMECAVTVHGFRATFRTWAAERTSFPREIAEVALGHAVGDATERSYQRGDLLDLRRRLMEQWASFVSTVTSGEVAPIRAAV